ncbi:hypothetical protein V8E36_003732 [Tilletia maclaganii]
MMSEDEPAVLTDDVVAGSSAPAGLSKRAQKRLKREQRWEELKPLVKAQRKEKQRLAKEARKQEAILAKEQGDDELEGEHDEDDDNEVGESNPAPSKRIRTAESSQQQPQNTRESGRPRQVFESALVIDLGFDHLMTDKEIKSLAHQLTFVYAANRQARSPFRKVIFVGQGRSDSVVAQPNADAVASSSTAPQPFSHSPTGLSLDLRTQGSWKRWRDVQVVEEGGISALWTSAEDGQPAQFDKEDIVYLTADSDTIIHALEEGKAYVLGGLVDKNRYKSLCLEKAKALGIQTAQLPISDTLFNASDSDDSESGSAGCNSERGNGSEPIKLRTRKVLTVNQVVDILVGWTQQRADAIHKQADAPELQTTSADSSQAAGPAHGATQPSAENERWWRAAVRNAFPQRKLKARTVPRRRPRNEELAALAAAQQASQKETDDLTNDVGNANAVADSPDADEDELYNEGTAEQ